MKPFFDLHCHTTMKYRLVDAEYRQTIQLADIVELKFKPLLPPLRKLINASFGDPIDSQSSLHQLLDGTSNLVSVTIYALENAYANSKIISLLNKFGKNFDEEITVIMQSEGLIGVSLDVRVLGKGNEKNTEILHQPERVSKNELIPSN